MKAVKRRNATGQFFWIGSDGWAARALVYEGRLVYEIKAFANGYTIFHKK